MARLNLELSDTYEGLIERLQPLCDLRTKKDVIENALLLLAYSASETSKGLTISAVDEKNHIYKEIQVSALEGAKTFVEREANKKREGKKSGTVVAA